MGSRGSGAEHRSDSTYKHFFHRRKSELDEVLFSFGLNVSLLTSSDSNDVDTASKACSGHGKNQSMIALLIKPERRKAKNTSNFSLRFDSILPGKFRQRVRNVSPVGDMQRTTCKFTEHFVTKYCQMLSFAGLAPFFIASSRTFIRKETFSSSEKPKSIDLHFRKSHRVPHR